LQRGLNLRRIKVGHAGTLDPLATGMVIVCTGKATKNIDRLMVEEKHYLAKVKFGATTPSFDLETGVDQEYPYEHIGEKEIETVLNQFLGEQEQIPPGFSAIRINGKRAFHMARKGEEMEMKARKVIFHQLKLLNYQHNEAEIFVRCSKGTYIRALARDLGIALGSGAYLSGLRRTATGTYSIDKAMTIEEFDNQFDILLERWRRNGLI
jgi:tRNA pseudouridine55 synthase